MKIMTKKLWTGILILALLTPLGLFLPELFNAGDAWGEWSTDTIKEQIGFIPSGMEKNADMWHSPVPDYSLVGEDAPALYQYLSYIASAFIGIAFVSALMLLIGRLTTRKE